MYVKTPYYTGDLWVHCTCVCLTVVSKKTHWMLATIFTNTATWAWRSTTDSNDRFLRETTLASNKCLIHVYQWSLFFDSHISDIQCAYSTYLASGEFCDSKNISDHFAKESLLESSTDFFSTKKNGLPFPPNKNDPSNTNSFINSRCFYVSRQHFAGNNSFQFHGSFPWNWTDGYQKKYHMFQRSTTFFQPQAKALGCRVLRLRKVLIVWFMIRGGWNHKNLILRFMVLINEITLSNRNPNI